VDLSYWAKPVELAGKNGRRTRGNRPENKYSLKHDQSMGNMKRPRGGTLTGHKRKRENISTPKNQAGEKKKSPARL